LSDPIVIPITSARRHIPPQLWTKLLSINLENDISTFTIDEICTLAKLKSIKVQQKITHCTIEELLYAATANPHLDQWSLPSLSTLLHSVWKYQQKKSSSSVELQSLLSKFAENLPSIVQSINWRAEMAVATPGEIGCLLIGLSSSCSTQSSSSPLSLASHLSSDVESMVITAAIRRIKQTLHTTSINTIILILNGLVALYNDSTTDSSSNASSSSYALPNAMTEAICKVIRTRLSSTSSSFTTTNNNKHSNSHIPCRALCTILHNLAHLDHRDGRLLSIVSNELVQNHLDRMPLNWLVTVLWSYGKLKYRPAELLSHAVALRFNNYTASCGGRGIEELLRQSLSAHEISLLANALATLSYHPTTRSVGRDEVPSSPHKEEEEGVFTTTLETVCREVAGQISPSEMATVLWSLDKISSSQNNSSRIAFYLPLITDNMSYFTPKDLAYIVRVLGNATTTTAMPAVPADHVIWTSIADQATSKVEGTDIQDILRILTIYQALGLAPEQLLAAVESWANARLQALTPSALSTALVSYAKLGGASPRLLSTAAVCATEKSKEFDPGQLARSVWAFATLKHHPGNVLLGEMEELLASGLPLFTDKDASNALWALTSLGFQPSNTIKMQDLLGGLVYRVRRRASLTSPQMLTSIGWSLAHWMSTSERDADGNGTSTNKNNKSSGNSGKESYGSGESRGSSKSDKRVQILLQEVSAAAIEQIAAFQPQGLSLLSWSFAKLGFLSQPFLFEITNYLVDNPEKLHMFEGQHLANLIWGIASVQTIPPSLEGGNTHNNDNDNGAKQLQRIQYQQQFLRQFSLEAYHRVAELRPQELFNVVWALAKLRYRSCRRLLEAAAKEATVAHAAFSPQELTGILWAIAKLLPSSASPSSSSSSLGSGSAVGFNRNKGKKKEPEAAVLRLREAGTVLFNTICKDFSTRQEQYSDGHLALLLWSGGQIAAVRTFSTTTKGSSNNSGIVSSTKTADESSSNIIIEFTSINVVVDALYNRVGNGKFNDAARLVMTVSGLSRLHTYTHYQSSSTMNSEGCTYALEDILMGNRQVQQQLRCHEYAEILASLTRLNRHSTVREILHSEVMKKKLAAGNSVIMGVSDAIWILWSMIVSTGGEYIEPIAGIACKKLYRTSPKYEFGKEELAALGDVFLITQQQQQVHCGNGLPTSVLKLRRPIREKSIAAALQNAFSPPPPVKHVGDVQEEESAVHMAEEQQEEEEDDIGDVAVKYTNGGWYG